MPEAAAGLVAVPPAPVISETFARTRGAVVRFAHDPTAFNEEYVVHAAPLAVAGVTHPTACRATVRAVDEPGSVGFADLCEGVPYRFVVTARNDFGSAESTPSPIVVPLAPTPPPAPVLRSAFGSDHTLALRWVQRDDGGSPLTHVIAVATDGVHPPVRQLLRGSERGTVFRHLAAGRYDVSVVVANGVGASPAMVASVVVGPRPPEPVRHMLVQPAQRSGGLDVSFSAGDACDTNTVVGAIVTTVPVLATRRADGTIRYLRRPGGVVQRQLVPAGCSSFAPVRHLVPERLYLVAVSVVNAHGIGSPTFQTLALQPIVDAAPPQFILGEPLLDDLDGFDGTTLRWEAPAPSLPSTATVGSVVRTDGAVPSVAGWLFATVTAIRHLPDGALEIDVGPANIGDAFDRFGRWSMAGTNQARVTTAFIDLPLGSDGRVRGSVRVTGAGSLGVSVQSGGADAATTMHSTFDIVTDLEITTHGPSARRVPLRTAWAPGFLPADWRVDLLGDLTITTNARIHARVTTRSSLGVELSWDSGRPETMRLVRTSERHDMVAQPTVSTGTSAEIDLALDLAPVLRIREQELLRADAELDTHVSATPDAVAPAPYLTMTTTTSGAARILAQGRGDHDVVSAALAALVTPLARLTSAAPIPVVRIVGGAADVAAGGSVQFDAVDRLGGPVAVSWSIRGGVTADAISADGVLDAALPAQRRIIVVATAADGREDFVVVAVT